ncbi:LysR family transcriptional regulator [Amycolatopsis sp. CA-128772]|uniref:LysR family transcriptional regulator n=1 Tax=Amycolatopsis sp. CA-128772 TaxID=2073159 RepID=UPI0018EBF6F7|nr:LysR family transcriptional regulator [Amycolatopsis sp. CA-128772]
MALDLNLLLALDALLQERNVSRAARRLGLSQPTVSASLGRLRRHFDDELLARVGNHYVLTPLAERLIEQSAQALAWTHRVFENRADFDPAASTREFLVVASDAQLPVFGRALAELLRREAPGVRLRFLHSTSVVVLHAQDQLRNVDALVLPQGILSGLPSLDLYRDRWACLVSVDDGRPSELDIHELRRRPWVVPYSTTPVQSMLHRLRAAGVEPQAAVSTEDFLAVPYLVQGTDRIGLVPERVARLTAGTCGLAMARLPFELGMLVEALWWHPMNEPDPGHVWFRDAASRAAASISDPL